MNLSYTLNTGYKIPLIGFGTYQIHGAELIHQVLDFALQAGYRHIDTAVVYRNEQHIGTALKTLMPKYNLKREDLFITSKLISRSDQDESHVEQVIKTSLKDLQIDYIDLYLIHWPGVSGLPIAHPDNAKIRQQTWNVFTKLHKEGLIRSVGVSNYTVRHLNDLLANCNGVKPAVNQVEFHPHFHQKDLLELCQKEDIFFQAYSSLGSSNSSHLREDSHVVRIARMLNKSPAQILLRWAIQQNVGVLPKASSKAHIDENIHLNFMIPEEDMEVLNYLHVKDKYAWNPDKVV